MAHCDGGDGISHPRKGGKGGSTQTVLTLFKAEPLPPERELPLFPACSSAVLLLHRPISHSFSKTMRCKRWYMHS